MSFLDERETTPRSTTRRRQPPTRGPGTDRQTLLVRRLIAGGVGVVVLILLILLIKSCRDSAREQSFKDFVRNANEIVQQSDSEGKQVFTLLARPGKRAASVTISSDINGYRSDAQQLVDRAKSLDRPDELSNAQSYLVEVLSLRRDGIAGIGRELPTALGDANQKAAVGRITIYMRSFLASDVIFSTRFLPALVSATKKEGLLDQVQLPTSRFLTDLTWLSPTVAAQRIGGAAAPPTPGPHGTGLGSVTVNPGGTTLQPGGAAAIKASPNLAFSVQVMNQGAAQEQSVTVKVTVTGAGKPIVVQQQIPVIAAGQTKTANLPLAATPPTGKPVTIQVQILPVPGEKNLTNNKQTFSGVFTK